MGGMDALPGFILAAVALAGSPGPATLSLTATGAAFGARRGAAYLAGIVAGMVGVMAVVASGLVGLLLAVPGAAPVVSVLAGAHFHRGPAAVPGQPQGLRGDGGAVLRLRAGARAPGARRRAQDDRVAVDHDRGQHRLAAGRRGAHPIVPRPGDQSRAQCRLRGAAGRVGRGG